ncbi:hypothetical protein Pla108_21950 [Botrimarina colliarenosi]|uniref:Uncharacterized protein n=2 Tax=Botrimarina colliarenosi TaxID=2528001 RepID=A0A5C6AF29_9BACT|nr:hypothetical protein Pla108_21950 [Botrimarina colliarenosi]
MGNRLYTGAVFVGWLAAMTWLVTDRILPPFFGGDAPATRRSNQVEPVAWRIEMGNKPCGVAVLQAVAGDGGAKEVHSYLQLDRIEAPKGAPVWLTPALQSLHSMTVSMRTTTVYDAMDTLSSFHSRLQLNKSDFPIDLRGRVQAGQLRLSIRVGDHTHRIDHQWPGNGVMGGDITPSGRLLPLYQGRRWTQEVYSPFGSPGAPMELIVAEVTEPLRLTQNGVTVDAWCVEYRSSEMTGSTDEGRLRAVLYVAADGRILKQEAYFLGSSITFLRESDERSHELASLLELEKYATVNEATLRAASPTDSGPAQR